MNDELGVLVNDERRGPVERWRNPRAELLTDSEWVNNGFLVLPQHAPRLCLFGGSGIGKTVMLKRLAHCILSRGWRLMFMDFKGLGDDQDEFVGIGRALGLQFGTDIRTWPEESVDIWRGSPAALVTKAMALLPPAVGSGNFYRQQTEGLLRQLTDCPRGAWRSTAELLERLHSPAQWAADSAALASMTVRSQGVPLHMRVFSEMSNALAPLSGLEQSSGWGWDESDGWQLGVMSIDSAANSGAVALAGAMINDLDALRVARRTATDRPLVLIVDEAADLFSIAGALAIGRLAEKARASNIGIVISLHGMIDDDLERLLDAGMTVGVSRMSRPDVAQRAGTFRVAEMAHQISLSNLASNSGLAAAREQRQFVVDPDDIRSAPPWHWTIFEKGARAEAIVPPLVE